MEYIYLSWYDIPEIVVPIVNSLIARKLLNQGILVVKLKSSLRKFYSSHGDLVNRYGISVSQMATAMLLFVIKISSLPNLWLAIDIFTRLTGRVHALVEKELLTFQDHMISPSFLWIRIVQCLATVVLLVIFCLLIFCSTLRGRLLS